MTAFHDEYDSQTASDEVADIELSDDWESGYADGPAAAVGTEGLELEERNSLRRVAGLSTELDDVTEVEYRKLRLERVVLVGVWTGGSAEDAENSLTELKLLAETAGSVVLEALMQRRRSPDPATYIGSGKVDDLRLASTPAAPTPSSATASWPRVSCGTSRTGSRSRWSTVLR
jgi:GTP-binding protein HflX